MHCLATYLEKYGKLKIRLKSRVNVFFHIFGERSGIFINFILVGLFGYSIHELQFDILYPTQQKKVDETWEKSGEMEMKCERL